MVIGLVTSWLTGRHVESSYDLRGHRFSLIAYTNHQYSLILVNVLLQIELSLLGIVYQILLFQQTP